MTRNKHLRWIWLVVIGAFLGAVLGNAIGASIHSDNLPFFGALGAAVGMGPGFMLFLWGWSINSRLKGREPGSSSEKR